MAFKGWPAEAIEFYEGLEADNTRAYWQDHKKDYEELVRRPMTGLELDSLVGALGKAGIDVTARESLKTAPKGYPKDHPRIDLLRHKGLIAWKQWPVSSWLGTSRAKQRIVDFFHASKPINDWLEKHVGATTM